MGTQLGLRPNTWLLWQLLRSDIDPEPFPIERSREQYRAYDQMLSARSQIYPAL